MREGTLAEMLWVENPRGRTNKRAREGSMWKGSEGWIGMRLALTCLGTVSRATRLELGCRGPRQRESLESEGCWGRQA